MNNFPEIIPTQDLADANAMLDDFLDGLGAAKAAGVLPSVEELTVGILLADTDAHLLAPRLAIMLAVAMHRLVGPV